MNEWKKERGDFYEKNEWVEKGEERLQSYINYEAANQAHRDRDHLIATPSRPPADFVI